MGVSFVSASVSDPFIVAQRSDGVTVLFVGDLAQGKMIEETLIADGEEVLSAFGRDARS